ncbi:MAG: DUF4331 domain-containing protein [Nocardioidaceae bacterium]
MSSHREAPEISKDPVADNTDVYAFVSPDRPYTVTMIANFIPLQNPAGGPNFYEFGDDVLYEIHISNRRTGRADVTYQFRFETRVRNEETFLYNTGPITSISDTTWNRPQFYSVTRVDAHGNKEVLGHNFRCPPVNIGPRSTPNYEHFTAEAVHGLPGGGRVFAGQRAEGFHVDLGSIFDLGTLRPFQMAHLIPSAAAVGVNTSQAFNVHSIAIQVPMREVARNHRRPTDVLDLDSVIGVYASASRQKTRIFESQSGVATGHGPFVQVSRLGNPLFNEVIVPMGDKDAWNAVPPHQDNDFAKYVAHPELGRLLPVLYPKTFPNLAAYHKSRADLLAILLTGIPEGVVPGFQNYTGPTQADLLRLNLAVPPASHPDELGVVAGDHAGFPNGRRVIDDVTTVELRAIAGLTIPLVDPNFTPDPAASGVTDDTHNTNSPYLSKFPYLGTPAGGYQTSPGTPHS